MALTACGRQITTEGTATVTNSTEAMETLIEAESPTEIIESLETIETMESSEITELSESTETPENQQEAIPEEAFDLSDVSPIEAFRMVLLNEAPFCYTDLGAAVNPTFRGYLDEIVFGNEHMSISRFTIMDMDGDAVQELLLSIDDYWGYIVLRYYKGKVVGYEFGYRSTGNIKKDGSLHWSNSAFNAGTGKLYFIGNEYYYVDVAEYLENGGTGEIKYYLHDVPVDEVSWDIYTENQYAKEDVEWYDINEESIAKYVADHSEQLEAGIDISEQQEYLDSLLYLFELIDAPYEDSPYVYLDKYNEYAKKYYYSCLNELNIIYEMCEEKFSGTELAELIEEQRNWQEGIDLRLVRDLYDAGQAYSIEDTSKWELYYTYGRIILNRTVCLVDLYFD